MAAVTHTAGFTSEFLDVLRQGALADVVSAMPTATALVVPTPSHERDALVAWARTSSGRPPLVITMSTLLHELCQAIVPVPAVLSAADAEAVFDHAARLCDTSAVALGVTIQQVHRWQRDGRSLDADSIADTPRRRQKVALLEQVVQTYATTLQEIEAVDSVTHLQQALAEMGRRVQERHRIRLRLRDEADVVGLVLFGMQPLPRLERLVLNVLAAAEWTMAIRWAEQCTTVGAGDSVDQDYQECAMALATAAVPWTHVDDATAPQARIHIVRCATKRSHDEAVLRIAKEHCLTDGLRPGDVAVVPAASDGVDLFLRERAALAGLPVADATSVPLLQVPIVSGMLAAADVVLSNWRRDHVERLARTGILEDVVPNIHRLLATARALRIVGGEGLSQWASIIDEALRLPGAQSDEVTMLRAARNVVDDLARALPLTAAACTAAEASGSIEAELIRPLHLEQTAQRWQRRDEASGRTSLAVEALRVAREALQTSLAMAHRLRADAMPLAMHVGTVRATLGRTAVTMPDGRLGGLRLLRAEALTGRTWPVVITTGWTEDAVAVRSADDVERLVAPGDREARARRTLLSALHSGAQHVYVLWPATIDEEDQMPATLLSEPLALGGTEGAPHLSSLAAASHVLSDSADARMHAASQRAPVALPAYIDVGALHPRAAELLSKVRSAPYSASRLDVAAACPYQFVLRRVVRLEQVSYDDARQTPLERGSMFHSIFHEFIQSLIIEKGASNNEGIDLREWLDGDDMSELLQRLHAVAERCMGEPTWTYAHVDARAMFGNGHDAGILAQWLANTLAYVRRTKARILGSEIEVLADVSIDGAITTVRGVVDRIDAVEVENSRVLVVMDYKNSVSSIPSKSAIEAGRKSQMILYAKAAEQWAINQQPAPAGVVGVYMSVGSKLHDSDRDVLLRYGKADMKQALGFTSHPADVAKSEQAVRGQLERLQGNTFAVEPANTTVCNQCGMHGVCRIAER